jgi:hypothetical protein
VNIIFLLALLAAGLGLTGALISKTGRQWWKKNGSAFIEIFSELVRYLREINKR